MKTKKELINYLGLLGVLGFISYLMAVVISPVAYPGYRWMEQAVSDLSALDSPSKQIWNQISSIYVACSIVSATIACIYAKKISNKLIRIGIYLYTIMSWISNIGYAMFPLTDKGFASNFQNAMHVYVITLLVVVTSILSLVFIMIGGFRNQYFKTFGALALLCFVGMLIGAIGTGVADKAYFGLIERFSCFSATAFNAILGLYVFRGFDLIEYRIATKN